MQTVLLTGVTGQVGSVLAPLLRSREAATDLFSGLPQASIGKLEISYTPDRNIIPATTDRIA